MLTVMAMLLIPHKPSLSTYYAQSRFAGPLFILTTTLEVGSVIIPIGTEAGGWSL